MISSSSIRAVSPRGNAASKSALRREPVTELVKGDTIAAQYDHIDHSFGIPAQSGHRGGGIGGEIGGEIGMPRTRRRAGEAKTTCRHIALFSLRLAPNE